jgi:hypothetical protein
MASKSVRASDELAYLYCIFRSSYLHACGELGCTPLHPDYSTIRVLKLST